MIQLNFLKKLAPVLLFCFSPIFLEAAIIYVNHAAMGADNGDSWTNAYNDLQKAIEAATSGDEIWVAKGTYYPTSDTDRTASFFLKNNVAIYGGFEGTEAVRSDRDWNAYPTILSGDIGDKGVVADNSLHVVQGKYLSEETVLDGFTVTAGNANQSDVDFNHRGGGLFIQYGAPIIRNCRVTKNTATGAGAGMANRSTDAFIENTFFYDNSTPDVGGGVSNNAYSEPIFYNCVFYDNNAKLGGAIRNTNSATQIIHCTFYNNTSIFAGGAIWVYGTSPIIFQSIFWGNSSEIVPTFGPGPFVFNCLVEGGYPDGDDILDADPLFLDPENRNLRLSKDSPARDIGEDASEFAFDIEGNPRPFGEGYDLGAYEYSGGKLEVEIKVAKYESGCASGSSNRVVLVTFSGNPVSYAVQATGGTFIKQVGVGVFQVVGNGTWSIKASAANGQTLLAESTELVYISEASATLESDVAQNDGTATVGIIGGTPPYTVDWSNGSSGTIDNSGESHTLTGLASGYYEATVTDENGLLAKACIYVGRDSGSGRGGRGRKTSSFSDIPDLSVQPNPFSYQAVIHFSLSENTHVSLEVFALNGKQVGQLFQGQVEKERKYGVALNSSNLPSGVYVLRLTTELGQVQHQRIVLSK